MKQDTVEFIAEENEKLIFTFKLNQQDECLVMCAKSEDERQAWVDALRAHIKAYGK